MARRTYSWFHRDGKRFVFETGILCNFVSTVLLLIAFVTPYWVVSWPRVHSSFKKLGLWEACFSGFVLYADPNHKAYHGCWWILTSYFRPMDDWLFPPYFVFVQVMVTFCVLAEIVGLVIVCYMWAVSGACQLKSRGQQKKRDNLILLQTATAITMSTAVIMVVVVLVFGLMVYEDIYWLPARHLNYLSWSYGLAIVSTCFSLSASVAQVKYVLIVRGEHLQPPKAYEVPMVTDSDKKSAMPLLPVSTSGGGTSSGGTMTPPPV